MESQSMILVIQTLILLVMILCGYFAFKVQWMDVQGWKMMNRIAVNVLNPFLILYALTSYDKSSDSNLVIQDFILSLIYYVFLILMSYLYVGIRRLKGQKRNLQQMMMIFSNIGFMGAPLIRGLYGDGAVFYLLFYTAVFNVLAYTYGIYLVSSGTGRFEVRKMFNHGTLVAILAIVLYFMHVSIPAPVATLCDYMGNAVIPISMIIIGGSLAQKDLKKVFCTKESWIISVVKLILTPIIGIWLIRFLPFDQKLLGIFVLMCSMPVAAMVGMLAEVYGDAGNECNDVTALSTVLSIVTIPIVFLFV